MEVLLTTMTALKVSSKDLSSSMAEMVERYTTLINGLLHQILKYKINDRYQLSCVVQLIANEGYFSVAEAL